MDVFGQIRHFISLFIQYANIHYILKKLRIGFKQILPA